MVVMSAINQKLFLVVTSHVVYTGFHNLLLRLGDVIEKFALTLLKAEYFKLFRKFFVVSWLHV